MKIDITGQELELICVALACRHADVSEDASRMNTTGESDVLANAYAELTREYWALYMRMSAMRPPVEDSDNG